MPWMLVAGLLVLALLGWLGYRALSPAKTAPPATFVLLSGERLSTAQLQGKVYMVNFWATSCVTCVKEMPDMVKTYEQFKDKGLEFVAVAMNYDPPMYVANFTETRKLPFKVALDSDGSAAKAFGDVQLTPTTFVVDKDGRILKRYVGEPEWDALHKLLDEALGGTV
ncbi:peroxiredoxin [Cupriavidus gilardii J11]|uniref:Peroxiredoxin n=1 Tax=Cupriavidus gilardii J11 TaxID=936133 RepID=A0A562B7X0_9BURK|nr:peroxiredoxin [Cupriavidus gilardii J11]